MELSFRTKVLLNVASAVFAVLSVFCPYLGIVAATIIVVFVINEIATRKFEKADFKKKIIHELWIVAGLLIGIPIGERRRISYNEWSSKDASFKKDALGGDYDLCKGFYESVDARNDFFASHPAYDGFRYEDSMKLKQSCLESFIRLYDTTMIQQSDLNERFDDIAGQAKKQRDAISASTNP